MYKLRPYQDEAATAAVDFLNNESGNGLIVISTGGGKSLIIAEMAYRLNTNIIVFCPSKEICLQNYEKMRSYGVECSMYSASVGQKEVSRITFAMIGSVKNKTEEFTDFKIAIVDEAHGVNSEQGQYLTFLSTLGCRVIGLTATPYRLTSDTYYDYATRTHRAKNARLTMLTNEENPFFKKIIYIVQTKTLLDQGYLADLKYYVVKPPRWNSDKMFVNGTGSEYAASSVQWMMEASDMNRHLIGIIRRLLHPKDGVPRKGILVFTQFVEDAEEICQCVADSAYVCGTTTAKNRERILQEFKEGKIKVLLNVGVLTTGYDNPSLDTVVIGRPTMSLALYYQIVGRAIRPQQGKNAWIVDCVGNSERFGYVSNLYIAKSKLTDKEEVFGWVYSKKRNAYAWKQLTGVNLQSADENLFT